MSYRLVADIGGTNSRLGLAHQDTLLESTVTSYRNDNFTGFDRVLDTYLSKKPGTVSDCVVAVAGPVHAGTSELTNRDWRFETSQISNQLGGAPTALLNDLAALGQACLHLDEESLETIHLPKGLPAPADQALVIGVGTGFNVSPVSRSGAHISNLNVEYGHISLPNDLMQILVDMLGSDAQAAFPTIEHVFSGRGYKNLSARVQNIRPFYAHLLAVLTRNLMLAFLPTAGIYFAGGVARNLLMSTAKDVFTEVFAAPFELNPAITAPVHNILDDAAALKGCATYAIE